MELLVREGNAWLLSRAKEPSTWKGIAILVGLLGWSVQPELLEQIITAVIAVVGVIEVARKGS